MSTPPANVVPLRLEAGQPTEIALDAIDPAIDERLRPCDEAYVEMISQSVAERGLIQPIKVVAVAPGRWKLVAGLHRLEAVKALGWTALRVGEQVIVEAEADADRLRLDEIDENLCRQELNALDRALFLAERRRVYEKIHAVALHGGDRKRLTALQNIKCQSLALDIDNAAGFTAARFTSTAAAKLRLSEATVKAYLALARDLAPDVVRALRGTKVELQYNQLVALSVLPHDQQRLVIAKLASADASGATTVAAALEAAGIRGKARPPADRLGQDLFNLWVRASLAQRREFLGRLDEVHRHVGEADLAEIVAGYSAALDRRAKRAAGKGG